MTDQKSNCCCGAGNVCPTHGGSETPRTDAVRIPWHKNHETSDWIEPRYMETLERELAAMTKERDRLRDEKWEGITALEFERDTLRARVAELELGEFICKKCGIRKDGEGEKGDF